MRSLIRAAEGSTITLLLGIGIFGYGAYKFWELAVLPRVQGFVGA